MTKEEEQIEEEILDRVYETMCKGRDRCKGCPHFKKVELVYMDGCSGKVAIEMIMEARKAQGAVK